MGGINSPAHDPIQYLSWRDADLWHHRITRAEPRAWISAELLKPDTQPERLGHSANLRSHYIECTWHGNMSDLRTVTLRDDCGQDFIYRAVRHDPALDAWLIEWPD
jgi:hypothetical protein